MADFAPMAMKGPKGKPCPECGGTMKGGKCSGCGKSTGKCSCGKKRGEAY